MSDNTVKRNNMFIVPFSKLALHPNHREDLGDMDSLVAEIKQHGVLEPLRGYKSGGVFCVVNGKRRFSAMEIIHNETGEDTECKFVIDSMNNNDAMRLISQVISNGGKDFTPLEKARVVKELIDQHDLSEADIAVQLNYSKTYIKNLHQLIEGPPEFVKLVAKGDISATFAMKKLMEGKATVEEFMQTHKDGGFAKYQEQDLFDDAPKKGKKSKITEKDLNNVNSQSELKKYLDKADYLEMWEGKLYSPVDVFKFFLRIKNNEIVWDDIRDFFMATNTPKERKSKDDIEDESTTTTVVKNNGETIVREYPK